ncbi:MAG: hypothetical protein ACFFHV_14655 [Promethearchaeota archaeon]
MPCIHGLDEINCPSCRIMRFSLPKNPSKVSELYLNPLKPEAPFFRLYKKENENFINETKPNLSDSHKTPINIISTPNLLNELPNFENKMLEERLGQIEVSKSEILNISKISTLASPEWKIEDKD